MSSRELAAILTYDSGAIYRVKGWLSTAKNTREPFENPAELSRLGPDGWHRLEPFDSSGGSNRFGLKTREELIDAAIEIIDSTYERDAALINLREFPYKFEA